MKNRSNVTDHSVFQQYLASLDNIVGGSGRYLSVPTQKAHPFWLIAYDSVPEVGSTTAFTFGISSIPDESWILGRPELVISIDSEDDEWLLSLGAICSELRGTCPFSLGNTLRFGKPLSSESDMSSFFLFWPTILEREQSHIELLDRTLNLIQAYPIFDSEVELISKIGAETFFMLDGLEFSDVTRDPVA
jgi:hypothetical protein